MNDPREPLRRLEGFPYNPAHEVLAVREMRNYYEAWGGTDTDDYALTLLELGTELREYADSFVRGYNDFREHS